MFRVMFRARNCIRPVSRAKRRLPGFARETLRRVAPVNGRLCAEDHAGRLCAEDHAGRGRAENHAGRGRALRPANGRLCAAPREQAAWRCAACQRDFMKCRASGCFQRACGQLDNAV